MESVVFLGEGNIDIRTQPDPVPGPDEVVVRIKASGMCGTDLHHLHSPYRHETEQIIEGHEPCGVVEQIGQSIPSSQVQYGDRVMVHHYDGCRTCLQCRSGWTQHCDSPGPIYGIRGGDGAHATFMKVPAHTLVPLPDELSFTAGAAISCGTGTAYGALKRAEVSAEDTVAIFGQGPVGLSATLLAKTLGATVIALEAEPARMEMSKDFGADNVVDVRNHDYVEQVIELTRGKRGVDKSLECSANLDARRASISVLRHDGISCLVGVTGYMPQIDSRQIIQSQKTIKGSQTFSKSQQSQCAAFVIDHNLNIDSIFTHEFTINQAREAYAMFDQRKIGKGVFVFD